tara:strand:+ start:403 stop:504 length:102 start_codon:yes stop_codon:yes gene_type:complete
MKRQPKPIKSVKPTLGLKGKKEFLKKIKNKRKK